MGAIFFQMEAYDSALVYFQENLASSCIGVDPKDLASNPLAMQDVQILPWALTSLFAKGECQEKLAHSSPDSILPSKGARETFLLCTQVIEKMRKEGYNTIEELSLLKRQFLLYEAAIRTQLEQYQVDGDQTHLLNSFIFAERSKGFLLLSSQAELRAKSLGAIPQHLVDEENRINRNFVFYKDKVRKEKAKGPGSDSLKLNKWEHIIFDLEHDKDVWEATVEAKYPDYIRQKNRSFDIHPEQVQDSLLEEGEILIEYLVGEVDLYTFVISGSGIESYSRPIPENLEALVGDLERSLSDYQFIHDSTTASYALYTQSAYELYQLLIAGPLAAHPESKKFLIVPDGILHHIPFEALLCEQTATNQIDFLSLPYLIKRFPIRYGYSAALMLEAKRGFNEKLEAGVLALAPSYGEDEQTPSRGKLEILRDGNVHLAGAQKEIETLSKMGLEGQFLFGPSADEATFKQLAPHYSIIHLAMHGQADLEDPVNASVRFTPSEKDSVEDQVLHAYELQALPMQADLAVLSSCESGTGQFAPGEGVMSLSRHFMASGVRSVVSSLWKVDDAASADLMEFFYEELEEGESSADALYKAKIRFLQQADSRLAHPYYWASFLAHGDEKPAPFSKKPTPWVWLGVVAMAGLLWGIQRKGSLGFRKNKRGHAA